MRRSRRMLLTAAVTALLPAAALLSSGLTAPATGASLPTLAQAFNNVGITSRVAHRGRELRRHRRLVLRLRPGRGRARARPVAAARRHDDHLARRRARRPGQRGRRRPDDRAGRDRIRARRHRRLRVRQHHRNVHRRLLRRHQQHRHGHARRLGRHQRRLGHRPAGHHGGLEPRRQHAGQPVLRGDPADRGQAGHLRHAAHREPGRRQERIGDARLQPHDRLPGRRGAPARPAPPPTTTRHARTAWAPPPTPRPRPGTRSPTAPCPTSTPRRSTTPTSRAWTRS